MLGVMVLIPVLALSRLHKTQCVRVDIAGLCDAVCVLEIQQGTLHANAVDTITVQWAAIGIAVPLAVHHRLQLPDLLAGLTQAEGAVVEHRAGCHALAMLWLQGQAAAGQVIDIVAKLPVVVAVHFHMDVDGRSGYFVLRTQGLAVRHRLAHTYLDVGHVAEARDDLAARLVENIDQALAVASRTDNAFDGRRHMYLPSKFAVSAESWIR